jgi:hypothetical protein
MMIRGALSGYMLKTEETMTNYNRKIDLWYHAISHYFKWAQTNAKELK